jgi:Cytochrome c554 and c-prime
MDAGDLFFPSSETPETLKEQSKIQARALARALKTTGLKVLVPGEKDFSIGVPFFKELLKLSGARGIAANLEWRPSRKSSWRPLLQPSAQFNLSEKGQPKSRVAVLGLIGTSLNLPENLRASDPIAAARKWVRELKKNADVVIALTHQGLEEDRKLARAVPGFDHIIGGHTQSFLQKPVLEGRTQIHQSSFRNQHVGLITLMDGAKSELVELGSDLDPGPEEASKVRVIVEEMRAAISEANLAARRGINDSSQTSTRLQTFVQCAECHSKQFDFWRKTPHASAFEVLVHAKADTNKECLACHTVGLGSKMGYSEISELVEWQENEKPMELAPLLKQMRDARSVEGSLEVGRKARRIHASVQCENCHTAVGDHPFGMESKVLPVEQKTCLGCHTPARAPTWYNAEKGGNGELDLEKLKASFTKMACPRDEPTP